MRLQDDDLKLVVEVHRGFTDQRHKAEEPLKVSPP